MSSLHLDEDEWLATTDRLKSIFSAEPPSHSLARRKEIELWRDEVVNLARSWRVQHASNSNSNNSAVPGHHLLPMKLFPNHQQRRETEDEHPAVRINCAVLGLDYIFSLAVNLVGITQEEMELGGGDGTREAFAADLAFLGDVK